MAIYVYQYIRYNSSCTHFVINTGLYSLLSGVRPWLPRIESHFSGVASTIVLLLCQQVVSGVNAQES
jgi:hypothetical protein